MIINLIIPCVANENASQYQWARSWYSFDHDYVIGQRLTFTVALGIIASLHTTGAELPTASFGSRYRKDDVR